MKRQILSLLSLSFFQFNCQQMAKEKESEQIIGIYTLQTKSNWSIAADTIEIRPFNSQSRTYMVIHRTEYKQITKGVAGPKQYESDSSIAVLDVTNQQLQEQRHGRIYSFPTSHKEILLGAVRYQKVE